MESPTTKGRIPKLIVKAIIMITQITIRRILERNSSICCLNGISLEEEEKDILFHHQINYFLLVHGRLRWCIDNIIRFYVNGHSSLDYNLKTQ